MYLRNRGLRFGSGRLRHRRLQRYRRLCVSIDEMIN